VAGDDEKVPKQHISRHLGPRYVLFSVFLYTTSVCGCAARLVRKMDGNTNGVITKEKV
jgi:hypothetical protein